MTVDPVLIPAVLSLTFQGIIGIISQIQHSRCTTIRGCGFDCTRLIDDEKNDTDNATAQQTSPENLHQMEYVAPIVRD